MIARKEPFSFANCCQSGSSLWVWMYAFLKVGLLSLLQLCNKARSYFIPARQRETIRLLQNRSGPGNATAQLVRGGGHSFGASWTTRNTKNIREFLEPFDILP
jgi:hypothetical protein